MSWGSRAFSIIGKSCAEMFCELYNKTFGFAVTKLLSYLPLQDSFRTFRVGVHHDQVNNYHVLQSRKNPWLACLIARTYPVWKGSVGGWIRKHASVLTKTVPILLQEASLYAADSSSTQLSERLTHERTGSVFARTLPSGTPTLSDEDVGKLLQTLKDMSVSLLSCYHLGRSIMRHLHTQIVTVHGTLECEDISLECVRMVVKSFTKTKTDSVKELQELLRCANPNEVFRVMKTNVFLPYPIHVGTLKHFWFSRRDDDTPNNECTKFVCLHLIELYQAIVFLLVCIDQEEATQMQQREVATRSSESSGYMFESSARIPSESLSNLQKTLENMGYEVQSYQDSLRETTVLLFLDKVSMTTLENACNDVTWMVISDWYSSPTRLLVHLRNVKLSFENKVCVSQQGNHPFFNVYADFRPALDWIRDIGRIRETIFLPLKIPGHASVSTTRVLPSVSRSFDRATLGNLVMARALEVAHDTRPKCPRGKKRPRTQIDHNAFCLKIKEWLTDASIVCKEPLQLHYNITQRLHSLKCFEADKHVLSCSYHLVCFSNERTTAAVMILPSAKIRWIHQGQGQRYDDEVQGILFQTISSKHFRDQVSLGGNTFPPYSDADAKKFLIRSNFQGNDFFVCILPCEIPEINCDGTGKFRNKTSFQFLQQILK